MPAARSAVEPPPPRILAGRYEVLDLIGRGGMGAVYRGRDLASGDEIAVKRLDGDPTRARRRASLAHEVRAMAKLRHPGICRVIDFGFERGSHYIVMELVAGRPLSDYVSPGLAWPALRALGIAIARTLAHAHAGGVLHLDLKPANIHVLSPSDIKIVDFGIARFTDADIAPSAERLEEGTGERLIRGSRAFMAPEQAAGADSLIGPASDLFALGVILYLLASGRLPFATRPLGAPLAELVAIRPRAFEPRGDLPERALRAIVAELLEPDPLRRGDSAADVARKLEAIETRGSPSLPSTAAPGASAREANEIATVAQGLKAHAPQVAVEPLDDDSARTAVVGAHGTELLELGETAVTPIAEQAVMTLAEDSVGEAVVESMPQRPRWGLFGIKEPALEGRAAERELLLDAAAHVINERRPRVVILRGDAGVGKSHLARWLYRKSLEDGTFAGLAASYGRGAGDSGVRGALATALGAKGSTIEELRARAMAKLGCDPVEATSLAAVLRPGDRRVDRSPREVASTLVAGLRYLARKRPLLLFVDDAHLSTSGAVYTLFEAVLAAGRNEAVSVLVVATEASVVPDEARVTAERLKAARGATVLTVGALDPDALRAIATDLLPLDERTASDAARRAAGNPLHLTSLLALWVETSALAKKGDRLAGPRWDGKLETLDMILRARVDAIASADDEPELAIRVLERVALLGRGFDLDVLYRSLRLSRHRELRACAPNAVERWLAAGILRESERGVVEIEPLALETILRDGARSREGYEAAQKACARAKQSLVMPSSAPDLQMAIAQHLAEAGMLDEAASFAIEAGRLAPRIGGFERTVRYCNAAARFLGALDNPPLRLRAQLGIALAPAQFRASDPQGAKTTAVRAVADARADRDPTTLARALIVLGDVLRKIGETADALVCLVEASELSRVEHLDEPLGRACYSLANMAYLRGDLDLARDLCLEGHEAARRAGEHWTALWCCALRRAVALSRGDFAGALEGSIADREEAIALGFPLLVTQAYQHAAEVHVAKGDYQLAIDLGSQFEAASHLLGEANFVASGFITLAAAHLGLGRASGAEAFAERAETLFRANGLAVMARAAVAERVAAAAMDEDWTRTEEHVARLEEGEEELWSMELEPARWLGRAGRAALAAGRKDLARRALARALVHLRRLAATEVGEMESALTRASS